MEDQTQKQSSVTIIVQKFGIFLAKLVRLVRLIRLLKINGRSDDTLKIISERPQNEY